MDLNGKRVLITGASRGIGRHLAEAFARAGAAVALLARDGDALSALAADLGGTAHPTDLLDATQVDGLIERVEREAGPLDVVVNNAGLAVEGPLWEHATGDVHRQVQLNLTVPLELCRQAIPRLLSRDGGHLVNVASLAAVAAVPGMTAYAGTKAGIAHASAALRDELKGLPIGVTTVMVAGVPTDMLALGESYPPFHQAFDRLRRIRLAPDTAPEVLAAAVVAGVERGKATVYLPKRALPFVAAVEAPRRVVRLALTGVARRT